MAEIGKCQGEVELISIGTAPMGVEMVSFVVTWDWVTLLLLQDSARYDYNRLYTCRTFLQLKTQANHIAEDIMELPSRLELL